MTQVFLYTWLLMTLAWAYSALKRDVSIVDSIYAWIFIITCWAYALHGPISLSSTLLNSMITLWGVRLSFHITFKNLGKPEDRRYQSFRQYYGVNRYWWFSYFQVFLLQWLFALTFAMPIHIHYLLPSSDNMGAMSLIGLFLFIFGFLYEAIADFQLLTFKNRSTPNQLLDAGLWHFSRHPNYFGEIILWYGITIFVISIHTIPVSFIALIGPICLHYTITKLSGPNLQTPHLKENYNGYQSYRQRTPAIIPSWLFFNTNTHR